MSLEIQTVLESQSRGPYKYYSILPLNNCHRVLGLGLPKPVNLISLLDRSPRMAVMRCPARQSSFLHPTGASETDRPAHTVELDPYVALSHQA